MAFEAAIDEGRLVGAFYLAWLILLAGIVMVSLALHRPEPLPANSKAFGCYVTSAAPPILLDGHGMAILQTRPIRIAYHLERHKNGIALTAQAPIYADRSGDGYLYSISRRGEGQFLDFFRTIDGRNYGVMDEDLLHQFSMLALDGTYLNYAEAKVEACGQASAATRQASITSVQTDRPPH